VRRWNAINMLLTVIQLVLAATYFVYMQRHWSQYYIAKNIRYPHYAILKAPLSKIRQNSKIPYRPIEEMIFLSCFTDRIFDFFLVNKSIGFLKA
jgi:hypothetical protein